MGWMPVAACFPVPEGPNAQIGSGHGRWTQFLQGRCSSLIGIDLVPTCIERCTQRFAQDRNLEFHVNDGLTFPMVENESIDFAFSFDSLVHAESDVMRSYTKELARVLKPGAVAFLHHSNLAAVHQSVLFKPWRVKLRLSRVPYYNLHWRAASMSAEAARIRAGIRYELRSTGNGPLGHIVVDDRLLEHDHQFAQHSMPRHWKSAIHGRGCGYQTNLLATNSGYRSSQRTADGLKNALIISTATDCAESNHREPSDKMQRFRAQ